MEYEDNGVIVRSAIYDPLGEDPNNVLVEFETDADEVVVGAYNKEQTGVMIVKINGTGTTPTAFPTPFVERTLSLGALGVAHSFSILALLHVNEHAQVNGIFASWVKRPAGTYLNII